MVDRSVSILKFLSGSNAITTDDLDTIWAGQESIDEATASAVHAALRSILMYLDAAQLEHFSELIVGVPAPIVKIEIVDLLGIVAHSSNPGTESISLAALERLWELTRDDAEVEDEVAIACNVELTKLLTKQNHSILKTRRKHFMDKCIKNLKDHNSVPQALDLLRSHHH